MNKLWRIGNHLSKMGWVPRKISRILELINHLICACSVSIDAEIGNRTIFYHRGIGCVVHPKAVIGEDCKIFQGVTIGSKWSKASCLGEAPRWMSEHGLEWFYRFLQEPKRMFKRYFVDDIKIVKLIFKYAKKGEE